MAEKISWNALPNIPRVMTEFVAGNPDVIKLLGGNFSLPSARIATAERRLKKQWQAGLGTAVLESYNGSKLMEAQKRNLELLNRDDTLAIVTGQQIGLFGGPLFTLYKAFHTCLLAEQLAKEAPGAVVPLFWMETADADFGEVNRIAFPPAENETRRATYTPRDVVAGRSVSLHQLTTEIDELRDLVKGWLSRPGAGEGLTTLLDSTYQSGRMMPDAFRELLTGILGKYGILTVDARHPALTKRTRDFWDRALAQTEKLNDPFIVSSRELDSIRLPRQVQIRTDALPLFIIGEDGIRRRVLGADGEWRIGSDGERQSNSRFLEIARENWEGLSPSALLRPLLQDWLLPTWIYVGGPAEVSYHAQIGRAYDTLGIERPLIAPRMSLTLVERAARRSLDKHNWSVADVIGGREIMLRRSGKTEALEGLFDAGAEHLQSWLKRIERAGDEAGITLYDEIDVSGRKIEHQWNRIRTIALNKVSELDRSRVHHAEKLLDRLVPDGMLQERHTSYLYYLSTYGDDLLSSISKEVDCLQPEHIAIDLGGS